MVSCEAKPNLEPWQHARASRPYEFFIAPQGREKVKAPSLVQSD